MGLSRIDEALKEAKERLREVSDRPLLEAQILLGVYLKKDRLFLHTHPEFEFEKESFFALVERRANFEPIEYITKRVSFYGKDFFIDEGVLIPRPETERLIEEVSSYVAHLRRVAEIGVGSGVISIILKLLFPHLQITATDINPKALEVASLNAKRFGVDIELVQTSYLDGIEQEFDMMISNPPYIKNGFLLERNVAEYEPKEALFGGEKGDEVLKKIIDLFLDSKTKLLACEMGYDQKSSLRDYFFDRGFRGELLFYKDLAGLDRGFIAKKG